MGRREGRKEGRRDAKNKKWVGRVGQEAEEKGSRETKEIEEGKREGRRPRKIQGRGRRKKNISREGEGEGGGEKGEGRSKETYRFSIRRRSVVSLNTKRHRFSEIFSKSLIFK